ncbi:hypothetical protein DAPK24_017930 [Pichia kluyveri]|uniref:Enolase-phosphatase E1 n=1 Tax=Pichia kluyveri TaxID=36015 RepID=A0AAV5R1Y2_PICKL|nr:hypothetical protein DAPK24_017930 [Pichia kluyveri]
MQTEAKYIVLDIEGTICPISFVKDELFPFFLKQLPNYLDKYSFPLKDSNESMDDIEKILIQFPNEANQSKDLLIEYINDLVNRDIKDPVLKQLQGFIWENG